MRKFNYDRAARALADGAAKSLVGELSSLFKGTPHEPHLDSWVRFALDPAAEPPETDPQMRPFVESVRQLKAAGRAGTRPRKEPSHLIIGRDLDFLGQLDGVDAWTPVQYLNRILMERIHPEGTAAVVGTMRDDGIFAIEWIAHYLALGFEHLFIYTNDNADGSEYLLRTLANHGVITLIESKTSGKVRPELKAFEHALHLSHAIRNFEWLMFVDSDEFLMPAPQYNGQIRNVLNALCERHPAKPPSAILYEWLWYVSGMVFEREPGTLTERFQYARPHWLTKTLVRVSDIVSMRPQHHPELKPGRLIVNSAFKKFDLRKVWKRRDPCYSGGWVGHFWPKSFEEFSLKKARGDALKMKDNEYSRDFGLFFKWNGIPSPETHYPPDPAFVERVTVQASALRGLEGVEEAEEEVNRRFRALLSRFDAIGGLREIYAASRTEPAPF